MQPNEKSAPAYQLPRGQMPIVTTRMPAHELQAVDQRVKELGLASRSDYVRQTLKHGDPRLRALVKQFSKAAPKT